MAVSRVPQKNGLFAWKLLRWTVLGAMVLVIVLMLKKPPSIAEPVSPAVAKGHSDAVRSKLADLESARQRGETAEAHFSSEEINAVFQQSQREQNAQGAADPQPVQDPHPLTANQDALATEPSPEISTTRIAFEGDHATGQFVVRGPAGKDIYLTVSGKIKAVDGYASFAFTEGKIGDMPVPLALLNSRL